MGATAVLIWVGVVCAVGVNGFAAGIAAMLYIWRKQLRRGARTALAAFAAGTMPATLIAVIGLSEEGFSGEGPLIVSLAFGGIMAVGAAVALPGAMIVARGLERPGDEFRAFE